MDENELKNSQMTVYEFIDFIDAKTSKFDDPYLNVQLFGDGSGYREFPRKPRPLAARMNWKNKFKIT
jgi:hypothetical protein